MAGPAAVPGVDPSRVSTPDELAACLDGLRRRRGLSYEAMEKAAAKLPPRPGGSRLEPLPKSTVGEIVTGKRLPTRGKLLTFLAVCEVAPADLAPVAGCLGAGQYRRPGPARRRGTGPGRPAAPAGRARGDQRPGSTRRRPAAVRAAGCRRRRVRCPGPGRGRGAGGGFVLLVGGSSVGKTRCACRGGEDAAAGLVAGASGRAGQVTALAPGAAAADGGVAG